MINILTIIGARPQFVKAAVVSKALSDSGISEQVIHTGQHYDYKMSNVFWDELNLPAPSTNLAVGSGSHGKQTGLMMEKIEDYIINLEKNPHAMLVYGDTNSTLAGALVASKLHIPVIHVEAGLRSFNRKMPEEINRLLTDQISDILFCSSKESANQLHNEKVVGTSYVVGDVMYDAFKMFSKIAEKNYPLNSIISQNEHEFFLATIHRPHNTDTPDRLSEIISSFSELNKPVIWPVHPRNKSRLLDINLPDNLILLEPVSYFRMNTLIRSAYKILTDSGGLQKEAYWAKKPCITIREETEWTETLKGNWNQLTGANSNRILKAVELEPNTEWIPLYGNGNASKEIATVLQNAFNER